MGKKSKGKQPAQQQRITAHALPRIKQPSTIIGKQIKVLGAFWSGRQTVEEKATEYCCSVRDHSLAHKFKADDPPAEGWQVQEMGISGRESTEHGDSRFPMHFLVFKQMASHLPHEANVEQYFSRAGNLSDPNMDPVYLGVLVMVGANKSSFKPTVKDIMERYYKKYRGKGGIEQGEAGDSCLST